MIELNLINESSVSMPKKFLSEWCSAIFKELRRQGFKFLPETELTIVFLNPARAKKLNRDYRSRDYATDVLSFSHAGLLDGPPSLGDLVLCPQVLQRQAKEQGHSFRRELAFNVLHGILHLLGYDHETGEKDAKLMFALQDKLFAKLFDGGRESR